MRTRVLRYIRTLYVLLVAANLGVIPDPIYILPSKLTPLLQTCP